MLKDARKFEFLILSFYNLLKTLSYYQTFPGFEKGMINAL